MTANGPGGIPGWASDDRAARMAWSRLAEPGDRLARVVRHRLGHVRAVGHVLSGEPLPVDVLRSRDPEAVDGPADPGPVRRSPPQARAWLDEGLERWRVRLDHLDPDRDAHALGTVGGRVVVPGDAEWPSRLDDLGLAAPACLWVRGTGELGALAGRSVALVGARACTAYGERVASDLAAGVAGRGWTVISGGAFGIDAAAHRGALAAGGPTLAIVACGVDRAYPRAHERLLDAVADGGVVLGETPPGGTPSRWRFLERNRLIAAGAGATTVVEAAWRSGALSTAGHAVDLGRPLGAVPGPVTSPVSAGCHRLLRDMGAVCVTDADEVVELAAAIGAVGSPRGRRVAAPRDHDGLEGDDLLVYEALSPRADRSVRQLAHAAGVPDRQVRAALGRLALLGVAHGSSAGDGSHLWRRARPAPA